MGLRPVNMCSSLSPETEQVLSTLPPENPSQYPLRLLGCLFEAIRFRAPQ